MLPLIITPGDPLGIGPEVSCAALVKRQQTGKPVNAVLLGDGPAIVRAASQVGLPICEVARVGDPGRSGVPYVVPTGPEPIEVAAIIASVAAIQQGRAGALVTGPVNKQSISERGFPFLGHTEFLGELCGGVRTVMGFAGGRFRVALVTTHLPLREVADAIVKDEVLRVLTTTAHAMTHVGIDRPRLIVCGLNPHAGEGGLLGHEEVDEIAPAITDAVALGIDAIGPVSAEAAFRMVTSERDIVVAMYHDQGLAPLKLVDFGRSVNWTLGLPIIRTSVDHGTAYDIAWTGRADSQSMLSAIGWAERLLQCAAARS